MVNSSQNLQEKIPKKVDFFLFLTRPTIWVYNRLIVMFLTFYCFYYVFLLGPFCSSECRVTEVAELYSIGTAIFVLPFKNVLYLFRWSSFDLNEYSNSKDVQFAVIQQVLIWTTILDLLMDLWSISQIFQRSSIGKSMSATLTSFSQSNVDFNDNGNGNGNPVAANSSGALSDIPEEQEEKEEKEETNVVSPSTMDMAEELEMLNHVKDVSNNKDNATEAQQQAKRAQAGQHQKGKDTVDQIMAQYDENNLSELETDIDDDDDDNDVPGYNKVASESTKAAKQKQKVTVTPPQLAAIESGAEELQT